MKRAVLAVAVLCASTMAHASETAYASIADAITATRTVCKGIDHAGQLECAAAILHGADGYTLSDVVTGTVDSFAVKVSLNGRTLAAIFHTHPTHGDIDRMFSDNDVAMARALNVPSYILVDGIHLRVFLSGSPTFYLPHAKRPSAHGAPA